jgi:hypothetical protein
MEKESEILMSLPFKNQPDASLKKKCTEKET